MKTSWERTRGKRVDYVYVDGEHVVVGRHFGSGHTDEAGYHEHEELLDESERPYETLRDKIRKTFGGEVFTEVIAAIKAVIEETASKQG